MAIQLPPILVEPAYGYARPDGTPYRPTVREAFAEWLDAMSVWRDRRRLLPFVTGVFHIAAGIAAIVYSTWFLTWASVASRIFSFAIGFGFGIVYHSVWWHLRTVPADGVGGARGDVPAAHGFRAAAVGRPARVVRRHDVGAVALFGGVLKHVRAARLQLPRAHRRARSRAGAAARVRRRPVGQPSALRLHGRRVAQQPPRLSLVGAHGLPARPVDLGSTRTSGSTSTRPTWRAAPPARPGRQRSALPDRARHGAMCRTAPSTS